jgi:hypothetical protein
MTPMTVGPQLTVPPSHSELDNAIFGQPIDRSLSGKDAPRNEPRRNDLKKSHYRG